MSEVNEHIKLVLTSENPDWDPISPLYAQQESEMTNWKGQIRKRKKPNMDVLSVKFPLPPIPDTTTPNPNPHVSINAFTSSLLEQVNISSISPTRRNGVSTETLAEKWDIGLTTENRTTKVTTQRGVRTVDHPSLQRSFRTNDRQI